MLLPASRSGGGCATVRRLLHSPTTDAARRLAFVPSQSRLASSHFSRHARPVSNPSAADRCPPQPVPECLLQQHAPRFIQHAIPTRTIAQIETDRQLLLGIIPTLLHCYGANLLHCRSPLSLALRARR